MVDLPEPPTPTQLKVKAWTAVLTVVVAASCLLHDWDKSTGTQNVFSAVRPAVKGALNRLYGVDGGGGGSKQQQQQQQRQQLEGGPPPQQ